MVKGQALIDFQVETTMSEKETPWHVYVDGLFTTKGSGVRVVLVSPQGDEVGVMVRLNF